jgi:hypothetical protein
LTAAKAAHRGKTASGTIWSRVLILASLSAAVPFPHARAQSIEFKTPAISVMKPDWPAAVTQLKAEIDSQPAAVDNFNFMGPRPSASDFRETHHGDLADQYRDIANFRRCRA